MFGKCHQRVFSSAVTFYLFLWDAATPPTSATGLWASYRHCNWGLLGQDRFGHWHFQVNRLSKSETRNTGFIINISDKLQPTSKLHILARIKSSKTDQSEQHTHRENLFYFSLASAVHLGSFWSNFLFPTLAETSVAPTSTDKEIRYK